jgi:hypothetical protein
MELPTDHQETMFEEPAGFDPSYEEDASYEPADEPTTHASGPLDESEPVGDSESDQPSPSQPAALHPDPAEATPETEPETASEPQSMPVLTAGDFAALEERVLRAVDVVRRERHARIAAEERAATLETELAQLQSVTPAVELLRQEVESLRVEREQVRLRVERLLSQLDALEL